MGIFKKQPTQPSLPAAINAGGYTLDELFTEARRFGAVLLFTSPRDGTYSVDITFETKPGINLKAESGYKHPTPHAAFMAAIERTKSIAG